MRTTNPEALRQIESIQWLDNERTELNLNPDKYPIAHYAAEWGIDNSLYAVDQSMEERMESMLWKLAEELRTDFETACNTYHANKE